MTTSMPLSEDDKLLISYMDLNMKRNENKITDDGLSELKEIAEKENRSKDLEEMYNKVMTKEKTNEDYYALYEKYKKELIEAVKKAKEAQAAQAETSTISLTTGAPVEEPVKKEIDITKELKIIEYLNLEAKRSEDTLTPEEEAKIIEYASSIEEVKNLEDAHEKLSSGDINNFVLKDMREKYKTIVSNKLTESGIDAEKYPISDGKIYEGKVAMENEIKFTDNVQELITYFKIELKRENGSLTLDEEKNLIHLKSTNPKIMALEETHKRLVGKKLPLSVLKALRDKYKQEIVSEITSKGLNVDDFLPKDEDLYSKLAEYENTPIAEEYKNPKPAAETTEPAPAQETTPVEAAPVEAIPDPAPIAAPVEPVAETMPDPTPIVAAPEAPAPVEPVAPAPAANSDIDALKAENQKLKEMIEKLQDQINGVDDSKLPENFRELKKYFRLDGKRNEGTISEDEKTTLKELTKNSTNNMIEEIENTVRKKITGEYTEEEYSKAHEEAYNKNKALLDSEIEKAKTN